MSSLLTDYWNLYLMSTLVTFDLGPVIFDPDLMNWCTRISFSGLMTLTYDLGLQGQP